MGERNKQIRFNRLKRRYLRRLRHRQMMHRKHGNEGHQKPLIRQGNNYLKDWHATAFEDS